MIGTVNFDPNGNYNLTAGSSNKYYPNFFIQKMSQWPTGLSDPAGKLDAVIYPNPATDQFTVDLSGTGVTDAVITLFDMQGRKMAETRTDKSNATINIVSLPKGIYTVKVQSPRGSGIKKLVIN